MEILKSLYHGHANFSLTLDASSILKLVYYLRKSLYPYQTDGVLFTYDENAVQKSNLIVTRTICVGNTNYVLVVMF